MQPHPIIDSMINKISAVILMIIAISIHCLLFYYYTDRASELIIVDSVISVCLWSTGGYIGWYMTEYVKVWSARLVTALMMQFAWLAILFLILYIFGVENYEDFLYTLPIRFLVGFLAWNILFQWYQLQDKEDEDQIPVREETEDIEAGQTLERISVKDGTKIHIIHPNELLYIQACGDYVNLFTVSGQYVKEQTMKYLELHLPLTFVRIHRSCIVNIEQILRIELFGKESYHVRLKNGTTLRASITGYKLLKERLNL